MLFLLLACARLEEGDYAIDYSVVSVDTCDIYQGGQALQDGTGEISWEGDTLVLELDGSDEDLPFTVSGSTFTRATEGVVWFDDSCSLATEQEDVGETRSATVFEGETHFVGVLNGDCGMWDAIIADPCEVEFTWRGERQ